MLSLFLAIVVSATSTEMLQDAENELLDGDKAIAASKFEQALVDGELSEPERVIVYWNLYTIYDDLRNFELAAEYAMLFVYGSDQLLEFSERINRPEHRINTIIRAGNIKNRRHFARVALEIYWNKKIGRNCKLKTEPCLLPNDSLLSLYSAEFKFCGNASQVKLAKKMKHEKLWLVKIRCKDKSIEEYYFYER